MHTKDYIDGFNAAKSEAEKVALAEAKGAEKELNTVNLAAGQKERTEVRLKYAQIIAQGIRKLRP